LDLKKFNYWDDFEIFVLNVFFSGIFISPKGIISHVGSVGMSLVIWTLSGVIALLGAFCMAELGTTFPSAGGQYTYIYKAFGAPIGFMYLWCNMLMIS